MKDKNLSKKENKREARDNVFLKLLFGLMLSICVIFAKEWVLENILFNSFQKDSNSKKENVVYDGLKRNYIFHLPENIDENNEEAVPLVVVLHGASVNADFIMETSGMNDLSDEIGFIVVYPNGTGFFSKYVLSWNAGECCNFVEPLGVDDVGFIKFLVEKFQKEYNIDKDKIYIAGHSNGGMMAYRMGCEFSDSLAAIASVSASMMVSECEPVDFLPVVMFNDLGDVIVPYKGGISDSWLVQMFDLYFNSVPDSVSFWVKHNNCSENPQRFIFGDIKKEVYSGCKKDAEVLHFTLKDNVHSWPGTRARGAFLEKGASGFDASEIIWDFFKKQNKI